MYCNNCGKQNNDEAHYCKFCGKPLTIPDEQTVDADSSNQKGYQSGREEAFPASATPERTVNTAVAKGHPRIIGLVWGVAICAAIVTVLLVAGIAHVNLPGSAVSSENKVEGSGFDSPEEAITGYLEALQTGNLDNILSTFSVESYCENYKIEKRIAMDGLYNFSSLLGAGGDRSLVAYGKNEFLRDITLHQRQNDIIQKLYRQVLQFYGNFDEIVADGRNVTEESDIQSVIAALSNLSEELDFSTLEIGDVIYGEIICDRNYFASLNTIKNYGDVIGAEGYKSLAISFSFNGEYGILFMDTAKIGEKWYNVRSDGFLSSLVGLDTYHGGMIYSDDEFLIETLGQGGTSAGEALSEFRTYQDSVLSMYKPAIAEASQSEIVYEFGLEELNMSIDEMFEYFSMTELQNSDENKTVTQSSSQSTSSAVDSSSPEQVIEKYLEARRAGNYDEMIECMIPEEQEEFQAGFSDSETNIYSDNFGYFGDDYGCENYDFKISSVSFDETEEGTVYARVYGDIYLDGIIEEKDFCIWCEQIDGKWYL